MNESSIDKKYIDNLLNALSTSDALNMFSEIEKKIVQLLQCSSDDFLSLNDHFKNAFKESKIISQNVGTIIQLISDVNAQHQFKQLHQSVGSIDEIVRSFITLINNIEIDLKKTSSKYETFFISFNGVKQNINSYKLLLANQKISDNTVVSSINLDVIDSKILSFKKLLTDTEIIINNFHKTLGQNINELSVVKKNDSDKLINFSNSIINSFNVYIEKHAQSIELSPALKERTEKCSTHIANIITNLQYHDIIRQKIEHIQGTHKDIVNELTMFAEQEPSQAILHSRVKTFLKIRDIAGLQAAQLLHANKQYQLAIEEISVSLEEIINEMLAISQLGNDLHQFQTNDLFFNTQAQILLDATHNGEKFNNIIYNIKNNNDSLINIGTLVSEGALKVSTSINDTISQIKELVNSSEGVIKEQFVLLLDDFNKNKITFDIHLNEISNKLNIIGEANSQFKTKITESSLLATFNKFAPEIIESLKNTGSKVSSLLNYNEETSIRISNDIKDSLHNVKYYVLFEKVCEAIIELLNELNLKLNYGDDSFDLQSREINLKELKARYTMASEHAIHDQITRTSVETSKEETDKNVLNIAPNENSEADDDNLELF